MPPSCNPSCNGPAPASDRPPSTLQPATVLLSWKAPTRGRVSILYPRSRSETQTGAAAGPDASHALHHLPYFPVGKRRPDFVLPATLIFIKFVLAYSLQ
jgi:hypothetical protein